MTADSDKLESARTVAPRCFVPFHTARKNLRHIDKSFHVVNDRWFLPQSHHPGKWRLVARFRAMSLDGFHQRTFFPANISAGTDKHAQLKFQSAAENTLAEQSCFVAAANRLAKYFFLQMIFVANVENALFRAGHQPRQDHAFNQEMRKMRHDEAILDRARLAF